MIVALMVARRRMRPLAPHEPERAGITMVVARVKNPDATLEPLGELVRAQLWRASFGRLKRGDEVHVATPDVRLHLGDLVTVVGPPSELKRIVAWIGDVAGDHIDRDDGELDMRRIFVSNREVAGHALARPRLPGALRRRRDAGAARRRGLRPR